jgi:hypothetical protein
MGRIILVGPEPEPQRDTAPSTNLKLNKGGVLKMSQTVTVFFTFPSQFHANVNQNKKIALTLMLT